MRYMPRRPRWVSIPAIIVLLLVTLTPMAGAVPTTETLPDTGRLVDIGDDRSLYLECHGAGSPTVLLEAGYRSPATVWTTDLLQPNAPREMVLPALARHTRVCAYERPGVAALLDDGLHQSRSDPVVMHRSAGSVVADLHALLDAADEPGPYVLVGHSLGGLLVRLYASTYPDEVAGLVLVDAWYEELETLLAPSEWEAYVALNAVVPPELESYADLETIDFADASATMREAALQAPPGDIPVAVVSKGQPFGLPGDVLGFPPAALEAAWAEAQDRLAVRLPRSSHVIAEASSHYVQLEQPELVIAAGMEVIDAVRAERGEAVPVNVHSEAHQLANTPPRKGLQ